MNAREIVNLLLEADQPSAADHTGVYVFGPYLPDHGYNTPSVESAIKEFKNYGIIDPATRDRADMLDQLVGQGYTFFIKHDPGNVEVIGNVPVKTTEEGKERAAQYLGLDRHTAVAHRKHAQDSPKKLNVEYALYGSRELERSQERATKERQRTADRMRKLRTVATKSKKLGSIDPEAEGWQEPPTGVGYSEQEMMPLDAPVQIGATLEETPEGLVVREAHPAGPSAQAGIQAGDLVLEAGKFARRDGKEPRAYGLKNLKHLEFVLRSADPKYPIPFHVRRGDQDRWIPVLPVDKLPTEQPQAAQPEQAAPQEIPHEPMPQYEFPAEAPAEAPAAAEHEAGHAGRPRQMSMARQLFAGQRKRGPYQRKLPLRPNAPTPARETGNQPANVSSVT